MRVKCWDCLHHQRRLFETELGRPLFYTSVCVQGFELRFRHADEFCAAFHSAFPNSPSSVRVTEEGGLCL